SMKVAKGIVYLAGTVGPSHAEVSRTVCLSAFLCYIPLLFINYTYVPFIAAIDMNESRVVKKDFIMDYYDKAKAEIIDMDVNDSLGDCNFMMKIKQKKIVKTTLRDISNLKLQQEITVRFPSGKEILNGKINSVDEKTKVIAGTYGE